MCKIWNRAILASAYSTLTYKSVTQFYNLNEGFPQDRSYIHLIHTVGADTSTVLLQARC